VLERGVALYEGSHQHIERVTHFEEELALDKNLGK